MALFLMIVFVVGMMMWLFGGGFIHLGGPESNPRYFFAGTLLPWLCVACLGFYIFVCLPTPSGPPPSFR